MMKPESQHRPAGSAVPLHLQLCWAVVVPRTSSPFYSSQSQCWPAFQHGSYRESARSWVYVLGLCWPTWHYVTVVGQGITLIENKQFPFVKTVRKLFQVLVDATLELEHFLAHSLCVEKQEIQETSRGQEAALQRIDTWRGCPRCLLAPTAGHWETAEQGRKEATGQILLWGEGGDGWWQQSGPPLSRSWSSTIFATP